MSTHTYVVCEVGQNHNGSMDTARQLIDMIAMPIIDEFSSQPLPRADAVKFTKRDLSEELTDSAMQRPYNSEHSFGETYGEHRAFLELDDEQHHDLYQYAKSKGLDFVETLCSTGCLDLLDHFTPDYLKVASRDLTNLPLLDALAETEIPLIISTGMGGRREIEDALDVITKHHFDVTILHCLSQYPAEYQNINLRTIPQLREVFPKYRIGYSDHSIGVMIPAAAVSLGAEVIEKHVTLSRSMKGNDHAGSLAPEGVWRMVRDIRNAEEALGAEKIFAAEAAGKAQSKLERSVAARQPIAEGARITEDNLHMLSPGDGLKWNEKERVVGKRANTDIPANELIYPNMVNGGGKSQ